MIKRVLIRGRFYRENITRKLLSYLKVYVLLYSLENLTSLNDGWQLCERRVSFDTFLVLGFWNFLMWEKITAYIQFSDENEVYEGGKMTSAENTYLIPVSLLLTFYGMVTLSYPCSKTFERKFPKYCNLMFITKLYLDVTGGISILQSPLAHIIYWNTKYSVYDYNNCHLAAVYQHEEASCRWKWRTASIVVMWS